jgi:hypothetical protein
MDVREPRVRRRGFFLHSSDAADPDTGEHENPEGFIVRVRIHRSPTPRQFSGGRQRRTETPTDEGRPAIRSGSVTGSRQRAHWPR